MRVSRSMSDVLKGIQHPLRLTLHDGQDEKSALALAMSDLAASLQRLAGEKVELHFDSGADELVPPARPALSLGLVGGPDFVHYLALPEGPEEAPFVELLRGLGGGNGIKAKAWSRQLAALTEPAELFVFIAPTCPHCPKAVGVALAAALASDLVKVVVIDAMRFPELAERYKVHSVPVTIIDGGLSLTGVVSGAKLSNYLLERGEASHDRELFRSLVSTGRHEEAAGLMFEPRMQTPFLEWWRDSTLTDRISLMLVCEASLERARDGLDAFVPALIELTTTDDASLRGDTADLLGKIGSPDSREALLKLCDDSNADVAEIAAEALEEIGERRGR